jgi:hypothetical protein
MMGEKSYLLLVLIIIIGCSDKKYQTDDSNRQDTVNCIQKAINEDKSNEIIQGDYKILPVDESGRDSTLVTFINNLKQVVSNTDLTALLESLDTGIIISHGGGVYGIEEFSKKWHLDKPDESELWATLNKILNMGGTWEIDEGEEYFSIPYTQSNKAFNNYKYDFDWYFTAVCILPEATVYKEPQVTSTKLATLNYHIVEMDPEFMKAGFTKIHTIDKQVQGYVETSSLIYSSAQYLVIKKIDNTWKVASFAPYD